MDLRPYVEDIQHQLVTAGEAGGEDARALAERLLLPLDAAIRLALQDALAAAAEEITCELAREWVELGLGAREPEFVVTAPPAERSGDDAGPDDGRTLEPSVPADADDGAMSRINLRMPDQLKAR